VCGIAGIVDPVSNRDELRGASRRMIARQRHRGPDGEGYYDADGVSLGHARLAIIDLSDAGSQPMADSQQRFWITYNGEIYNFIELRRELEALGHTFRGHSDTEVLLAAYKQWGNRAVEKLRGMFAFAIWDGNGRSLFAARDRFGIKPFHYVADGRRFVFASELKALVEFLPRRRANDSLATQFLAWNLLDHEAERTFVDGILRLPPAHTLTWTADLGVQTAGYWTLRVSDELVSSARERTQRQREFAEHFRASVSLHLRSDVAVGTCLSGGLDSSSIVGVVSEELRRRGTWQNGWQHTFSACFDVPRLDERPYIQSVVRKTGCESHLVFPSGEGMLEDFDRWLWHQEEPVASTGSYSQYCVARLARATGIKVLLDGQGADEMLAGYRKFILVYLRQLAQAGRYAKAAVEAAAFFSSPAILKTSRLVDGRRYLWGAAEPVSALFNGSGPPARPSGLEIGPSLARRIEADLFRFSLPVLLRYEDRNTMAFGLESRVPFIDHVFAEWAATLPADLRLSGGWTKRIVRDALADVLPDRVRRRKSKLGFSTPESEWLNGPLRPWLRERLLAARHLADVVEPRRVRALFDRWQGGDRAAATENLLFRLAVYESWARMFVA
jgi:asparagine synthase (glutamine-hydrolysing)